MRLHADRNPHNDKNAYGITFYCGFFTCANGFSELRLNNNLTGGWCICIRIWVVLNVVGRVDGIMMASGLIEIHKISWESKGTPQCQVFPPRNSRPYHCPLFRPFFLERTWYWGRPPLDCRDGTVFSLRRAVTDVNEEHTWLVWCSNLLLHIMAWTFIGSSFSHLKTSARK